MGERNGGADMDTPTYSRLFVACGKQHTEEELREVFSAFGEIETLYIVKDNQTKESRGIAFVKYKLTSCAALAQEKVGKLKIGDDPKPISVCIAASKTQQKTYDVNEMSSRNRLYVILPEGSGEKALQEQFSQFDGYESSHMVRNRSAGFVTFSKPSLAALAMENCDRSFHAVVAEPREGRSARLNTGVAGRRDSSSKAIAMQAGAAGLRAPLLGSAPSTYTPGSSAMLRGSLMGEGSASMATCLYVKFDRSVTQDQLARLCDAPPGMVACQLMHHMDPQDQRLAMAAVTYQTPDAAHYAKERLSQIEYPPRSPLWVSYSHDHQPPVPLHNNTGAGSSAADARRPLLPLDSAAMAANSLPYAHLPSYGTPQALQVAGEANSATSAGMRAFFVCTPSPPPITRLRTVFSCYGGLEKLWLVGDHNYGYAEFDNPAIAQLVISQLNGTMLGNCKLKVVKAEPRRGSSDDNLGKKNKQ